MSRTIKLLHSQTVALFNAQAKSETPSFDINENANQYKHFLHAPAFCYCFHLIYLSLTSPYSQSDIKMVQDGLQIISHHSKIRGSNMNKNDLYHPELLPIQHVFQLLIDVISMSIYSYDFKF